MKKTHELLKIFAAWLENPENEIMQSAEDQEVETVAVAVIEAAEVLKQAAEQLGEFSSEDEPVEEDSPAEVIKDFCVITWTEKDGIQSVSPDMSKAEADKLCAILRAANPKWLKCDVEPVSSNKKVAGEITPEIIDDLAALAELLDKTGDEFLVKQASVLDELLMTLASPKNAIAAAKKLEDDRLEQLKAKYKTPKEKLDEYNKVADVEKAIEKSPYSEQYRPLNGAAGMLSQRSCVEHPGAQLSRVGEHTWQCCLDKKIYNYETGFTLMDGSVVPGGDVSLQTKIDQNSQHQIFDSRSSKLGINNK